MKIIEIENVSKTYGKHIVIKNLSYIFETGKLYAIIGHSGCGKTTLNNIIGLLDNKYEGSLKINGKDTKKLNETEKSFIRNKDIGFIFQEYLLHEYLTVIENVYLPLINSKIPKTEKEKKAYKLLEKFQIHSKANDFPKKLSGGEKQRVAIARALINDAKIILADEPTGNLDRKNEKVVFDELKKLSKCGKCVIVISHSSEILKYADEVLNLEEYWYV